MKSQIFAFSPYLYLFVDLMNNTSYTLYRNAIYLRTEFHIPILTDLFIISTKHKTN